MGEGSSQLTDCEQQDRTGLGEGAKGQRVPEGLLIQQKGLLSYLLVIGQKRKSLI